MPPPSRIPEPLLQEKRYVNVLGESQQGETPSPDRGKIKPVLPPKDKPRLTPGRVFTSTNSPLPGQLIPPAVQPAPPSPSPPLRYSHTLPYTSSPLSSFPLSFSDSNAWDSVPSILQKDASRLVRPSQYSPPPGSAFDFGQSRRCESTLLRNASESGEIGLDEEDTDDTGDEGGQSLLSKQRPRSGSFSGKNKEYRSQDKDQMSPRLKAGSLSGVSPALVSSWGPPPLPSLSSSSETASSASSASRSIQSTDTRLVHRAGGSAWDPVSGVEIFERKSEDVLARFLKMGSWEEEKGQPST
ncbi:hypothetical protein DFH94DRAFT_734338 [Russula ochroleuca]|uniref:Uncharacterized protein n=1 Tax=Russula ochroleuca TaxID=152965 RepID=A0A9P5MYR0_9AGAM|nr:hypothetical protein DFH94DRAFT_734338 [Russula ochroleuca]